MLNKRAAGILCPIFSLPSEEGIGTFGKKAYEFVDFLADTKQSYWQVLPMGLTSYGDSPYQSFSSYAGNPYFIDLVFLKEKSYLKDKDLDIDWGDSRYIDYEKLWNKKYELLKKAFQQSDFGKKEMEEACQKFSWLEDFSTYMALKYANKGKARVEWSEFRTKKTLSQDIVQGLAEEKYFHMFVQVQFYQQWTKLKQYANNKSISIIGDLPIFVSGDSADVWANPEYFQLDKDGSPSSVAGVPPDYFSETGQLWGNPLYDWDKIEKDKFTWWIRRIQDNLSLYDIVRIDHFRGFESYWSIPAEEKTAIKGQWIEAPGSKLFKTLKKQIPKLPIIAEDLGIITEEVQELIEETGFPGMAILQFAFDDDPENLYKPCNIENNKVVYTGTHDNDTTIGWFLDPKNKIAVQNALTYLHLPKKCNALEFTDHLIKAAWVCKANMAIVPIQDLLSLGTEARINTPSTLGNNWKWRMLTMPDNNRKQWLLDLTKKYKR